MKKEESGQNQTAGEVCFCWVSSRWVDVPSESGKGTKGNGENSNVVQFGQRGRALCGLGRAVG